MNILMKVRKLLLFSLALVFMSSVPADESRSEKSKKINKTFEIGASDVISVNNSFGQVHVTTWDEATMEVEVEVTVESRYDNRLEDMLEDITIDFRERGDGVYMHSNTDINTRNNEEFEINYTIKLPRTNPLEVKNTYGDIYLDDRSGEVDIDLSYGDLKAGNLTKGGELKLSFGKGDVKSFDKGSIELKYINFFYLDRAQELQLDQQYSELEIGSVNSIDMRSRHGQAEFGTVGEMDVNVHFTDFSIESLETSLDMDAKYATDFNLDKVSKDFEFIDIEGNYGSYNIDLEEGLKAEFKADFKYASMRALGVDIDYSLKLKEQGTESYKAKIGGGHASKRIQIASTYGDLRLTQ